MQNVELVEGADLFIPRFRLAGISVRTTNAEAAQTIPDLWARALAMDFTRLPQESGIWGRPEVPLVALYRDYESDHNGAYTLTVGVPVGAGAIDRSFEVQRVREGLRAHLEARGPRPRSIFGAWERVWKDFTPRRTFVDDLEVYWPSRGESGAVDLYISIRP
jgi:predicted transcriptional regulator YdeE